MQGRLTNIPNNNDLDFFPTEKWAEEFKLAQELNIQSIELVFDRAQNELNPLLSSNGIREISQEFLSHGLMPYSACLNFIIDNSITDPVTFDNCTNSIKILERLGVDRVILPLFGKSELTRFYVEEQIERLAIIAGDFGMQILIESNEKAPNIHEFIDRCSKTNLKVVYDIGNAAYCGHEIQSDLILLKENIQHIHIKDKDVYGNNVLLGNGIVDFEFFFNLLSELNYNGVFTLETSRGDDALVTAKKNIDFVRKLNTG